MASYVLNEDMFQRTRRAVRTVENQVTPANGPGASGSREYNAGISAYNAATEIIPAYGCVRIQGGGWLGDNRTRTLTVVKPSSTVSTTYALNGPSSIDAAKWGVVYAEGLCLALYDGTAPTAGDELGPVAGQWSLKAGYPAIFTVIGVVDSVNKIAYGRLHDIDPNVFYNDSSESVPAYGIMAVSGVQNSAIPKVTKPSTTYAASYIVNGPAVVAAAKTGVYQNDPVVNAAYDTGTPALNELWGPKAGQWTLAKGGTGTQLRADWGVSVAGILSSTGKILGGRQVCYGRAKSCTFKLTAALASTGASVSVDNVVPTDGGWSPVASSTATLTAYNTRTYEGDDNGDGEMYFNATTAQWEIRDLECPSA